MWENLPAIIGASAGLLSLLGGAVLWWNASYRKARIAKWEEEASKSSLQYTQNKGKEIKTIQDQMDVILEEVSQNRIALTTERADHEILKRDVERMEKRRKMYNVKVLRMIELIVSNCECDELTGIKIEALRTHAEDRSK